MLSSIIISFAPVANTCAKFCKPFIAAIIGLAESFAIDTIAEGVETEAQKDFLVAAGCHAIQGYFYSQPLIVEQAEAYIRHYQA